MSHPPGSSKGLRAAALQKISLCLEAAKTALASARHFSTAATCPFLLFCDLSKELLDLER